MTEGEAGGKTFSNWLLTEGDNNSPLPLSLPPQPMTLPPDVSYSFEQQCGFFYVPH